MLKIYLFAVGTVFLIASRSNSCCHSKNSSNRSSGTYERPSGAVDSSSRLKRDTMAADDKMDDTHDETGRTAATLAGPPQGTNDNKLITEDATTRISRTCTSTNKDTNTAVQSDTVSFMPVDIKVMSSTPNYHQMIDNSRVNYVAIRLRCGVTAMCRTNVLILCPQILQCLNYDVKQCLEMFPPSVHALIQRTRIWVNYTYSYGQRDDPRLLKHTTAHHADWWLLW